MKQLFIITKQIRAGMYGIGTYIRQLLNNIERSEWEVIVVVLECRGDKSIDYIEEGIRYCKIPLSKQCTKQRISDEIFYQRSVFYYLSTHIKLYDRIFCHFNFSDGYELAQSFRIKWNAKIIFTLHYMEWNFFLKGASDQLLAILRNPKGVYDNEIVQCFERERKFMADCCDRVIVVSKNSFQLLQDIYNLPSTKIFYLPHVVSDRYKELTNEEIIRLRSKYLFKEHQKLLLYAGRLNPDKGVLDLINAFKELAPMYPNLHLIIAGDGDFSSFIKAVSPFWNRVTFTGYANTDFLDELYQISDVGIIPSYHEELGYVAIEMLMHKLPIICSNASGLIEVVENGVYGSIFKWNKNNRVDVLKDAISSWLNTTTRMVSVQKCRQHYLSKYSCAMNIKQIELLYHI